jgi:hypothetical protein
VAEDPQGDLREEEHLRDRVAATSAGVGAVTLSVTAGGPRTV